MAYYNYKLCLYISSKALCLRSKLDSLSEEDSARFEFFFRSHFSRSSIKEILLNSLDTKSDKEVIITDETAVVVASLAKLFVGEIVESGIC